MERETPEEVELRRARRREHDRRNREKETPEQAELMSYKMAKRQAQERSPIYRTTTINLTTAKNSLQC